MRLHLDFETRCDLDLKKVGLRRYLAHPSFRVLMTAWSVGDSRVLQAEGLPRCAMTRLARDQRVMFHAFNAGFERRVLERCGITVPLERWRDTMAHSYARGFSGSLAQVGEQVGIPQDKAKLAAGSRLITKFCKPRRPSKANPDLYWTPRTASADWEQFLFYNRQDVEAERAVYHRLTPYPWTDEEQRTWEWDQRVNDRGIPVDMHLVAAALRVAATKTQEAEKDCLRATGGIGPGKVGALLAWAGEHGYDRDNLQSSTIEEWLNGREREATHTESDQDRDLRDPAVRVSG